MRRTCKAHRIALPRRLRFHDPDERPAVACAALRAGTDVGTSLIQPDDFARYLVFVAERQADFRRIATHTQGEYSSEDVSQQALLTAWDLQTKKGIAMQFADAGYRRQLLSHLYQHFVRYTETTVRRAVRCRRRQGDEDQLDLLAELLPADESCDPLYGLSTQAVPEADPDAQLSQASAWLFLVGRSGNEVRRLADHLLISVSHCYRCLAQARDLARRQRPLPVRCTSRQGVPLQPRGWRRCRYERRPTQLRFPFVSEPTLWRPGPTGPDRASRP